MWRAHAAGYAGTALATFSGGLPPDAASGGLFLGDVAATWPGFARLALVFALAATSTACQRKSGSESESGSVSESESGSVSESESESESVSVSDPRTPRFAPGDTVPAPWLAGAQRVVGFRVGREPYIAAAGTHWLRIYTPDGKRVAAHKAEGVGQVLEVADLDGDGAPELIVGRGMHRDALDAKANLAVIANAWTNAPRVETVPLVDTTRQQVVAAVADGAELLVAVYDSKYMVAILRATRAEDGTWTARPIDRVRVLSGLAQSGGELALARAYGEDIEADGYVTVGEVRVPSTRGARAIAAAGDSVVFADGWHREYGKHARALITRVDRTADGWRATQLANVRGRWGYDRLRIGDIDGDREPDVIAAGNGPAVTVPVSGKRPAQTIGRSDAVDVFPFDLDGDGRDEVLIAGETPAIWRRSVP